MGEPGVERRDISWRTLRVRAGQPRLELPRWVDRLVVVLLLVYLLAGITAAPFSLEESVQDSLAARTGSLWSDRGEPVLTGDTSTPAYDSVRLAYGSVTRWAAAVGWYAAGARQAQRPIDLDEPGPPAIAVPRDRYVAAARLLPALLSAGAVVMLLLIGRRLAGRSAGLVAATVLAVHPGYLVPARQAADAGVTLALGLACVLVAVGIGATLARGAEPRIGAWTAVAVLAGLTLAAGFTAVPYLAGAAAFVLTGLLVRVRRRRADLLAAQREALEPGHREPEIRPVPDSHPGSYPGDWAPTTGWRWRVAESHGAAAGSLSAPVTERPVAPPAGPALGWIAAAALGAVVVWVLVSPALWGWLPERIATRHDERPALVAQQLLPDPGPGDVAARAGEAARIATDPFLTPEPADPGLRAADAGYPRSWWAGLPLGTDRSPLPATPTEVLSVLLGALLTLAAAAGLLVIWLQDRSRAAAVTAWLLATALWMVLTPSSQPDQALPLVALACVLAGLAAPTLVSIVLLQRQRTRRRREERLRPAR